MNNNQHEVYLSLGSNMGDKKNYINFAIKRLGQVKGCKVDKISDMIITKPYGKVDQDDFLNCVVKLETDLTPYELLNNINKIEAEAKRERIIRWGPRTLDIDILLYDQLIIDEELLHIPHIDMQNREFVMRPLAQIAPHINHPRLNKTAQKIYEGLLNKNLK